MHQFFVRNVVPRLILRSPSVIGATTFVAMLPFFGDIMALFRAFGYIPLAYILPMILCNVTFKPAKQSLIFWVYTSTAGVSLWDLSCISLLDTFQQVCHHSSREARRSSCSTSRLLLFRLSLLRLLSSLLFFLACSLHLFLCLSLSLSSLLLRICFCLCLSLSF